MCECRVGEEYGCGCVWVGVGVGVDVSVWVCMGVCGCGCPRRWARGMFAAVIICNNNNANF